VARSLGKESDPINIALSIALTKIHQGGNHYPKNTEIVQFVNCLLSLKGKLKNIVHTNVPLRRKLKRIICRLLMAKNFVPLVMKLNQFPTLTKMLNVQMDIDMLA
jgi:hypothetical protein